MKTYRITVKQTKTWYAYEEIEAKDEKEANAKINMLQIHELEALDWQDDGINTEIENTEEI